MRQITYKPSKHFSPLRYPGGKACLSDFLTKIIELNKMEEYTYVEPYAGGAGAALTLLMMEKVEKIIINDLDKAVYSFWNAAINDTERFIKKIDKIELSITEWNRQRKIYKGNTSDEFKLGFAAFYLNRTNRSGILEGGPIGGVAQESIWKIDARFNKNELIDRIRKISRYRNRIKVLNSDGVSLINKLVKRNKIFTYLDPPYFNKGGSLYLNHYRLLDHCKLAEVLNRYSKMRWVLTYDHAPEIVALYKRRKKMDFYLNYHADLARKGHELMIYSDGIKLP